MKGPSESHFSDGLFAAQQGDGRGGIILVDGMGEIFNNRWPGMMYKLYLFVLKRFKSNYRVNKPLFPSIFARCFLCSRIESAMSL